MTIQARTPSIHVVKLSSMRHALLARRCEAESVVKFKTARSQWLTVAKIAISHSGYPGSDDIDLCRQDVRELRSASSEVMRGQKRGKT